MCASNNSQLPQQEDRGNESFTPQRGHLGANHPWPHRTCDLLTESVIYFMVVFSPWAFGTTQPWSITVMNVAGGILGLLLIAKWSIRWRGGWRPARWGDGFVPESASRTLRFGIPWPRVLAILTGLVLTYCLISAFNPLATYQEGDGRFEYHQYLRWLPHSLESNRTWGALLKCLALALSFWAIRDWLLTTTGEQSRDLRSQGPAGPDQEGCLPPRLQRLLWVICINGALLGLEGLFQRADGTGKLLWLVEPRIHKDAATQFGPYAYRSNAAQYFTLVWPVALGFWWALRRAAQYRGEPHGAYNILLPCAMLIAACPIFSLSRAGALVAVVGLLFAAVILMREFWDAPFAVKIGLPLLLAATIGLGGLMGWEKLFPRLATSESEFIRLRVSIWRTGWHMAKDFPVFGTGPGTFDPVFQLYRTSPDQYWPAQAHNDWLETLITFGWVGSCLVLLPLAVVLGRWFFPFGGIAAHHIFVRFLWLALGGCLVHAAVDFPMQIYSILFLFLLLCSVLFCLSREA